MLNNSKCWNCQNKEEHKNFFCTNCQKIQPPKDINEFELLGIEQSYDIDLDKLENRYLQLQKLFHPDKFSNSSEIEKNYSTTLSSMINDAYEKLEDLNSRANILLRLNGYMESDENKSFDNLEVLEEIMELQSKCLNTSELNKKKEILKDIDSKIHSTSGDISKSLDMKDFSNANKYNIKLSYLEKMRKSLKISL